MNLLSLSATAANVYLGCPARYAAEIAGKAPSRAGIAANLGSACHEVAQAWVEDGHYKKDYPVPEAVLRELWDIVYWKHVQDASKYDEGWKLMANWLARQDWSGKIILSTEAKKSFTLNTSIGPVPFNYIMDRVDLLDNGDVEVIDYKTLSWNVSPEDLKNRIQSRAYAAAVMLEHPDARRIWVTFDMFRYEPVGIVFSRAECEATLAFLHDLAERIIADNDPVEKLNPECRFCVRKQVCARLRAFEATAGDVLTGDIEATVARREELELQRKAIVAAIAELDDAILQWIEHEGAGEDRLQVGRWSVGAQTSRRRVVDAEALSEVLDYQGFLALGPTVGVSKLDALLKSGSLTSSEASQIRQAVTWKPGSTGVSVRALPE